MTHPDWIALNAQEMDKPKFTLQIDDEIVGFVSAAAVSDLRNIHVAEFRGHSLPEMSEPFECTIHDVQVSNKFMEEMKALERWWGEAHDSVPADYEWPPYTYESLAESFGESNAQAIIAAVEANGGDPTTIVPTNAEYIDTLLDGTRQIRITVKYDRAKKE